MGVRERCSGRGLGGRHKGRVNGAHQRGTGELAIEVIDLLVCVGELHCECRIRYVEMFFFFTDLGRIPFIWRRCPPWSVCVGDLIFLLSEHRYSGLSCIPFHRVRRSVRK